MIIWPAVDIRDGHAVRLAGGDFAQETVYDADPLDAARRWIDDGGRALHLVDLDGARAGTPANLHHVRRIAAAVDVPLQVGGGLRDDDAVAAVLGAGAMRAILGTAALRDPSFAERMVSRHGADRIVVSIDARGGLVATAGWTEATQRSAAQALDELTARGVEQFVYSSIDRDGLLAGPALDEIRALIAGVGGEVIYSGGVRGAADCAALGALGEPALTGVIVGTALYEGRLTIAEGQAALDAAGATG